MTPPVALPEPFHLTSVELTGWAPPRRCTPLEAVEGPGPAHSLRVELAPPAPDGATEFVLAPRYAGDELWPDPSWPVTVNVLSADCARLVAVGEIHRARADADARAAIGLQW